jgi:hypothetical protein
VVTLLHRFLKQKKRIARRYRCHRGCTDSDSDSDDEEDEDDQKSLARAMMTRQRPKQIDLKTTVKLNGIMTDEVIDLHQMIIGLKRCVDVGK